MLARILIYTVLISIGLGFIWLVYEAVRPPSIVNKEVGVAILTEKYKARSGSNYVFYFSYEGKEYCTAKNATSTFAFGDKFLIEFDKDDPDEHRLLLYRPIFTDDEKPITTVGKIERLRKFGFSAIRFSYLVNGAVYYR